MYTFGTLGHVDHGKSTLVRALTGIDPDRLAEEKAREMTIDLGFAWLSLASGEVIGIVDVPGHRDFIENMLAGITSVDAALLIIAADEGVMPQTREHVAILKLLNIQHGIIVMTKVDMIEDADWLELVESDVRVAVSNTPLANSPILRVSARTNTNLPRLVDAIDHCIQTMPPQRDTGMPKLPIDRIFTMRGFGTVVTGTLKHGSFYLGEEVEVQPGGLRTRIRTLQTHNTSVRSAMPGSRTAINLPSVRRDELHRGQVITRPNLIAPTARLDAFVSLLEDAPAPLRHNSVVKLFIGTAQAEARVRVLGTEEISPGHEGWVQLETNVPIVALKGDRCILRQVSPSATIGGGEVVNPHPSVRYRRFKQDIVTELEARRRDAPHAQLAQLANVVNAMKRDALQIASNLDPATFQTALQSALHENLVIDIGGELYMNTGRADALIAQLRGELYAHHESFPLQSGMPQEALRTRVGLKPAVFQALTLRAADIVLEKGYAALRGHTIRFSEDQSVRIDQLMSQIAANPFMPPSHTEAASLVGPDVLDALLTLGQLVRLSADVILSADTYELLVQETLGVIDNQGSVTVATVRDRFATSRKYALALLEHLDTQGITKRIDDVRVRGQKA